MMDLEQLLQGGMFWPEALPLNQSAFERYAQRPTEEQGVQNPISDRRSMNQRMMEFLRKSWTAKKGAIEPSSPERDRCYRHMINERMRRERQKHCFTALHSMLPLGTKTDKNSVILAAAMEIQKLQSCERELKRRQFELESKLAAQEGERSDVVKIKVRVANPSSGFDSMVEVLKCLSNLGVKTRAINSGFSAQEFSATLEIQTTLTIEAAEVEKAVQRTLLEVERKLLSNFQEAGRG